jgi:hypothetical protein
MSFRRLLERWTGRAARDLDRELRTRLDLETDKQHEAGLPPEGARYAFLRWDSLESKGLLNTFGTDGEAWTWIHGAAG